MIFLQNPPWFLWGERGFLVLCLFVFLALFVLFNRIYEKGVNDIVVCICLILLIFFVGYQSLIRFRTSSLVTILVFFLLFFLEDDEKTSILNKTTTILYFILLISFPLWIFDLVVNELPYFEMTYGAWKGDGGSNVLRNHIFFIEIEDYIRFYSIFDEPGVLGTLSAFLLFANKYNFRDRRIVTICIVSMFTFSLAYFVLTVVGFLLFHKCNPSKILKPLLLILITGVVLISFFDMWGTIDGLIFQRISSFNSSLGDRYSSTVNNLLYESINSGAIFLGEGVDYLSQIDGVSGAGYKFFLIENGIVGFLLVFGMYLFKRKAFRNYSTNIYLLLFVLSFLQRPYLFTSWQLILFYTGVSVLNSTDHVELAVDSNKILQAMFWEKR
jgi:hypothetical protein